MRVSAGFLLVALLVAAAPSDNAPADAYFGRLSMSALRIRYEIAQLKSRYDNHKLLPEDAKHLAMFAADAYYQWASRYPADGWLASTGYNLAKLYADLPGADALQQAERAASFVRDRFKNTRYARLSAALRTHLSLRPDPLWAAALRIRLHPSPSPSPARTASPQPSSSASTLPVPTPSPSPSGRPLP